MRGMYTLVLVGALSASSVHCGGQDPSDILNCDRPDIDEKNKQIDYYRQLMITLPEVIDDPCRTTWSQQCSPDLQGHWTFGYLMEQMAGDMPVSEFMAQWIKSWAAENADSGVSVPKRQNSELFTQSAWAKANYPLKNAPFRLLAIVNRVDLADQYHSGSVSNDVGEGRFVFGFTDPNADPATGNKLEGSVIFEYKLPKVGGLNTKQSWAQAWYKLGSLRGEEYNRALQGLTDVFVKRSGQSNGPNAGSNILAVRTNEIATSGPVGKFWEMRAYVLRTSANVPCGFSDRSCFLRMARLANTPDAKYSNLADPAMNQVLQDYAYTDADRILRQTHSVPDSWSYKGVPYNFLAGSIFMNGDSNSIRWAFEDKKISGIDYYDLRHLFSFATCNGCHYGETKVTNQHIQSRQANKPTELSAFIKKVNLSDKRTQGPIEDGGGNPFGISRYFNEPRRRACQLVTLMHGLASFALPNNAERVSSH